METKEWQDLIKEMIPSFELSLADDRDLRLKTRERTTKILKLENLLDCWVNETWLTQGKASKKLSTQEHRKNKAPFSNIDRLRAIQAQKKG